MGQIVLTIKEVSIQIELTYSHFTDKVTGSTPSLSQKDAGISSPVSRKFLGFVKHNNCVFPFLRGYNNMCLCDFLLQSHNHLPAQVMQREIINAIMQSSA